MSAVDAFVAAALGYEGTPFRHQGRAPGVGLDCAGVVVCALRAAGQGVADVTGYGRIPARGLFIDVVGRQCDPVPREYIQDGDVSMFAWRSEPQHIAIHVGSRLVHAWQDAGRVVVHDMDDDWRARWRSAWRFRWGAA